MSVTNDKLRLSKEDIEKMIGKERIFRSDDQKQKRKCEAMNALDSYSLNTRSKLRRIEFRKKLCGADRRKIIGAIDGAIQWLDDNQRVEADEYEEKLGELKSICDPIIVKSFPSDDGAML